MTENEIKAAAERHLPKCICDHTITRVCSSEVLCEECGRLYTSFTGSVGKAILAGPKMMEIVHVIFNGDVTTHTFIWEL